MRVIYNNTRSKMLRKKRRIKDSNKEGRIKVEMDSGAVKELSMKSSKSHPNLLEPEGEQPVAKMVENKMVENMKNNYLKEVSIQEELKKVKIENYLKFFGDGRYEFYKCSGCFGPQLGHIIKEVY